MKKFISGFIAGAIVFSTVAFAATYSAKTASFKVYVNGKEFQSSQETVVINGSTYMPLKAIGDVLGVPVKWNANAKRVEVGTPVVDLTSYSRNNPAPLYTEQTISFEKSIFSEAHTMSVKINGTERGFSALQAVKNANMFNSDPPDGFEYVLAKITVTCKTLSGEAAVNVNSTDFKVFTQNNTEVNQQFVVAPTPTLSGQIYQGGSLEGYLVFTVRQDDPTPKVVFGQNYDGSGGIWFSL